MKINEMSMFELENELNKLHKKKLIICGKMESGKLSDNEAQELYEPIAQRYNEIYRLIEDKKAKAYDTFVNCFRGTN